MQKVMLMMKRTQKRLFSSICSSNILEYWLTQSSYSDHSPLSNRRRRGYKFHGGSQKFYIFHLLAGHNCGRFLLSSRAPFSPKRKPVKWIAVVSMLFEEEISRHFTTCKSSELGTLLCKMQNVTPEVVEHPYMFTLKVHRLLCLELKQLTDKITRIFTAIESARPRWSLGIQVLCLLHLSIEKSMLLLRHCSESSKLYLALRGDKIVLRCEKIRISLESCLTQLQNLVEPTLAAQIYQILNNLKTTTFTLDSSEEEAGKVLHALLNQDIATSKSVNAEEFNAIKFAALRLNIVSPIAILIEKRSIKLLLGKIQKTDCTKKKILNYFLYLLRKYGKSFEAQRTESIATGCGQEPEDDEVVDLLELPLKYKSPQLNKIYSSCSGSSFSSSLEGLQLQVNNVSFRSSDTNNLDFIMDADKEDGSDDDLPHMEEKSRRSRFSPSMNNGVNLFILAKLSALPWSSRRKAVEDLKNQLQENEGHHFTISTSYIKPVFKFLKDAHSLQDSGAKRDGAELLLIFLRECRSEVPPLPKDAFYTLSLFLDSDITEEAFAIVEVLSCQEHYKSEIVASGILCSILKILKNPSSKYHQPAMKVLCHLSSDIDIGHHMVYLDFIPLLVPFLDDLYLAGYCVKIFKNLCNIEEARVQLVETDNCVSSIGELLEVCNGEEQELVTEILLFLCCQHEELREVLKQDGLILSLVYMSTNGTSRGKLISAELLQLLNDVPNNQTQDFSTLNIPQNSKDIRGENSCSKPSRLLGRKKSRFRKLRL